MKKRLLLLLCWLPSLLQGQGYTDYLGAGHMEGIKVSTSHTALANVDGTKSIDGFPIENTGALIDASRFLAQSTMGYDYESIEKAAAMGYEAWLDEQFTMPRQTAEQKIEEITSYLGNSDVDFYGMFGFRAAWLNLVLKHPDLLRQRVTHALSQIFVVSSFGSDLFEDVFELSTSYYDILNEHAFGNYRDLLVAVSRSPSMGLYLSHMNNPKSDPENNIHPDENYAREVMQLFSIGLYELNNDGTRKLDSSGNYIPTYTNEDIREFAKIFTGFGNGGPAGEFGVFFGEEAEEAAYLPMRMYDDWHEPGEKKLLNGVVVPAGQTGLQDFEAAMDNLFNHPNVGPFIGKALIQFLVSANPSSAYVNRVANAFNNNGNGVRGDMKAVIKAILLDPEARMCNPTDDPIIGKLREPIVRYTNLLKAFNIRNQNGPFFDQMFAWYDMVGQVPYYSPSVFNFYSPEFQPNGPIADNDFVGPVFQIHNSSTSIGYVNLMSFITLEGYVFDPDIDYIFKDVGLPMQGTQLDFQDELALVDQPEALVDRLNILLAAGQLSTKSKSVIVNAINQIDDREAMDRLRLAISLIMIAPEYAFLK